MSTLGDAADVNPVIKFLPHTCVARVWQELDYIYTECNRRNGPDFGRVFLMLNYTEKPQNTYIQSSIVTEI